MNSRYTAYPTQDTEYLTKTDNGFYPIAHAAKENKFSSVIVLLNQYPVYKNRSYFSPSNLDPYVQSLMAPINEEGLTLQDWAIALYFNYNGPIESKPSPIELTNFCRLMWQKNAIHPIQRLPEGMSANSLANIFVNLFQSTKEMALAMSQLACAVDYFTLDMSKLTLFHKDEFLTIIEKLPQTLQRLKIVAPLQRSLMARLDVNTLIDALKILPPNLTHFDMSGDWLLNYNTLNERMFIFEAIPPSVTNFNICDGNIFKNKQLKIEDSQNIMLLLQFLPSTISNVGIRINGDFELELIRQLPPFIKHLDLSQNGVFSKTPFEIVGLFEAIKATNSITRLTLANNGFASLNEEYYDSILQEFPPSVTHLSLSENRIFINTSSKIFIQSLPAHINHLSLCNDELGFYYGKSKDTLEMLCSIPNTIKHLELSDNYLNKLSTMQLIHMFTSMVSSIKFLNLSNNGLGKSFDSKKSSENNEYYNVDINLAEVIYVLPPSLETVDLRGNNLDYCNKDTQEQIFQAMLRSGIKFILDEPIATIYQCYIDQQRKEIVNALGYISRKGLGSTINRAHFFAKPGINPLLHKDLVGIVADYSLPPVVRELFEDEIEFRDSTISSGIKRTMKSNSNIEDDAPPVKKLRDGKNEETSSHGKDEETSLHSKDEVTSFYDDSMNLSISVNEAENQLIKILWDDALNDVENDLIPTLRSLIATDSPDTTDRLNLYAGIAQVLLTTSQDKLAVKILNLINIIRPEMVNIQEILDNIAANSSQNSMSLYH